MAAAFILQFVNCAYAQDSQFLFDLNGNLLVQTAQTSAPPQIIGQPQNRIVGLDEAASFTVVAADTRLLTYQWRFNGTNISSATNDAVLLQNVSTNNEGEYRVVLTNPSGSVTSAPAFLIIDSDADGLADSWELSFFGNLTKSATADFDGDGVSNLQEFLDGTNPTNNASARFRLTLLTDGGSVAILPDQSTYTNGATVTLTATASSNEVFRAWLGDIVTQSNPVTLVMTNNKTVSARFTPLVLTWTNFAGGNWHSATNWSPNLVPGSNDNVVISGQVLSGQGAFTVTLDTPAECAFITLDTGPSSAPTLTGSGTLTVRERMLWRGGTMSGSGRTVLESGATLMLEKPDVSGLAPTLNTRTLELRGDTFWSTAGTLFLNNAVITNRAGAAFHAFGSGTINQVGGTCRFDNAGTFHRTDGGTTTIALGVEFNNSGLVEIETGTLGLAGGGSATGTFNAAAGALVEWAGGTFTLNPGAQLNGAGLYKLNAGNVTANANLTVTNLDLVNVNSTLNGTGAVAVASLMNWTAGVMGGTGRTIIAPGATLNAAIPSQVNLVTRTLENGGTVLWTNGTIALNNALITNRPGALFQALGAGPLGNIGGSPRFDNAGTFRKSASTGTSTISSGLNFTNYGTVEVQTGTWLCDGSFANTGAVTLSPGTTNRLAGGGSASGTFAAPAGALVEWAGGTFTLNPGAQLNGAGLYKLNGGNVTADANLNVANLDLVSGSSTFGGTGTVTVASLMNWTAGIMGGTGRTIIAPGATLNAAIPSQVNLVNRTLENGGTVLWTNGTIALNNALITNRPGALFQALGAGPLGNIGGSPRFDNAGTFRKSVNPGITTFSSGVNFTNYGMVDLQSGTLLCNGSFANPGAVNLLAGTTNRLAFGGSASGVFTASAGAVVEWIGGGGTFTLNPGAQLNGVGLYKLNGGNVTANANLTVTNLDLVSGSSTLDGTGTVTVASLMNWTAGVMGGTGRTIIAPGATLNAAIPSQVNLVTRTLENGGTLLWANGTIALNGSLITNRPGALFHAVGAGNVGILGGSPRFDNAGTFRKSVNTGTTTISSGISFTNYGAVDIRSGILAASGGYISTSSALLNCALGGTTAGTNYGQLQVAGTVTLNGGLSVDLLPGYSPATNDSFTVVSAGTRNGAFGSFSYPSNRVTMSLSNSPTSVILRATEVFPVPQPVLLTPQLVGSNALLTWTATSNVTYRLESNPNPGSNWSAIAGDVITLSNTATKLDPLTPSNRFYRVRVLP